MKVLASLYSDVVQLGFRKSSASIWDAGDGILYATVSDVVVLIYQSSFENDAYLDFSAVYMPFIECFRKGFEVISYDLQAIMKKE